MVVASFDTNNSIIQEDYYFDNYNSDVVGDITDIVKTKNR